MAENRDGCNAATIDEHNPATNPACDYAPDRDTTTEKGPQADHLQTIRDAARRMREYADRTAQRLGDDWRGITAQRAVADWLDTAGADLWAHGPLCCADGCHECDDSLWMPHVRRALLVALAYLNDLDQMEARRGDT